MLCLPLNVALRSSTAKTRDDEVPDLVEPLSE